jgi:hypothetical protein
MTDNTPIIARTALLASLRVSQWTARKFDRNISAELNNDKKAQHDVLRVNKLLISADALKPLQSFVGSVRTEYYRVTLPWGDDGERLLPWMSYNDFNQFMDDQYPVFDKHVQDLVDRYRDEVRAAAHRMGDAFNIAEFPRPSDVAAKFAMSFSVRPIPTAEDFRIDLSEEMREHLAAQVRADLDRQTKQVMGHIWQQIGEMIDEVHTRLADPDARFRRGLLDNFVELVSDLDKLNIGNDPRLTELRDDARKTLNALRDPEALRKDKDARKAAAADVGALADKFGDFWGAF